MTVTEGLAELKTLQKRIEKKREYVGGLLLRSDGIRDPVEKDGGSVEVVKRERQAIADLETRHVAIRTAIQRMNHATPITVSEVTKTIAEWLTWRKEIAPGHGAHLQKMRQSILSARSQAQQKGWGMRTATEVNTAAQMTDVLVNVDEAALAKETEQLETILGTLDGQLSLRNATVMMDIT
jgi:hypothetical protein